MNQIDLANQKNTFTRHRESIVGFRNLRLGGKKKKEKKKEYVPKEIHISEFSSRVVIPKATCQHTGKVKSAAWPATIVLSPNWSVHSIRRALTTDDTPVERASTSLYARYQSRSQSGVRFCIRGTRARVDRMNAIIVNHTYPDFSCLFREPRKGNCEPWAQLWGWSSNGSRLTRSGSVFFFFLFYEFFENSIRFSRIFFCPKIAIFSPFPRQNE